MGGSGGGVGCRRTARGRKRDLEGVGAEHATAASRKRHNEADDCQDPPEVSVLRTGECSEALALAGGVDPIVK